MNYRMILRTLGQLLIVEAILMIVPLAAAAFYGERSGFSFLIVLLCAGGLGFGLSRIPLRNHALYAREGFVITALSWLIISLVGAVPFCISGQIPNYLNAVFETVSGFSTTGSSILTDIEALDRNMLLWRSLTQWIGGMGVLVFMLAIMPLASGQGIHLLRAESPGPSVTKMVPRLRQSAIYLYAIYFGLTLIETLLLRFGGMGWYEAVNHAFTTAGTGGFSIWNDSIAHYASPYIHGVITVFMILFGINFSVFFFLIVRKPLMALRNTELRWYLVILLAAVVMVMINIYPQYGSLVQSFHYASFAVATVSTSTGFGLVDYNEWHRFSKVLLLVLTFIGACGGSTGGGFKVSRIIILCKFIASEIRKLVHPRQVHAITMDGKRVSGEVIRGVFTFLLVYIILTVVSLFLVGTNNFDMETTFTAVLASLNNTGPGLGLVGPTGNYSFFNPLSKVVLCLDMLFGRLELFPMLILLLPGTWYRK